MIEEPPILTLRRPTRRPSAQQLAAFADVPTGFVVDAMTGQEALSHSIRAIQDDRHVVGSALTAWNGAGDVLATLAAIHLCQPGDVLVAAVDGARDNAAAGDRVCGMAKNAGAVALVTDGSI
ncbi:MAG: RraA family protein, partial [Pseudomonadota bacterium]